MIKLIIFDFDDTITDNSRLDFKSFKITCDKFNIKSPLTLKKLIDFRQKSYTAEKILKFIKKSTNNFFPMKEFLKERKNFLLTNESNNYLKIKPDTKLILKTLQKYKIPIFLCTVRNDKEIVKFFLKLYDIECYFQDIFCTSDLTLKIDNTISDNRILIKSSLLKKIIKKNKIDQGEMLFIGNSFEDRIASSPHKMIFIKFNNNYLAKENYDYEYSVNTMKNLNKIVKELL